LWREVLKRELNERVREVRNRVDLMYCLVYDNRLCEFDVEFEI